MEVRQFGISQPSSTQSFALSLIITDSYQNSLRRSLLVLFGTLIAPLSRLFSGVVSAQVLLGRRLGPVTPNQSVARSSRNEIRGHAHHKE